MSVSDPALDYFQRMSAWAATEDAAVRATAARYFGGDEAATREALALDGGAPEPEPQVEVEAPAEAKVDPGLAPREGTPGASAGLPDGARWHVEVGDCLERLAALEPESVDAIVTDPPYGLGFMGKKWDALPPGREWAELCLRVLKPGGHLLAFGGTRTYHRLACAIEDAGFEIRDTIAWLYGSGFPKSLDVSKAIDKAAGAEREAVGESSTRLQLQDGEFFDWKGKERTENGGVPVTAPATPDARRWSGWGTALKPAHEPIVVARKPLTGTVAANVLEHGTGALNIDGCRVEGIAEAPGSTPPSSVDGQRGSMAGPMERVEYDPTRGRWPANVVLDEEAARLLDEQTGTLVSGPESDRGHRRNADSEARRNAYGGFQGQEVTGVLYGDSGGASRFFYCAKASRAERNAGLDGFEESHGAGPQRENANLPLVTRPQKNVHPTVKPISLMRWLVRLVTPPGGLVLDPFTGSGTTGAAALIEGFRFLGFEIGEDYAEIARARIAYWDSDEGREAAVKADAKRAKRPAA